ncbi:MAG TPA: hypothetical protein PKV33_08110 [Methanothrix sp.]|nr:hypothetical protein [Methanothrix sp.]
MSALYILSQGLAASGGLHLRSPVGDAAYGIPRYILSPFWLKPETYPPSVFMTSSPFCVSSATANIAKREIPANIMQIKYLIILFFAVFSNIHPIIDPSIIKGYSIN